MTNHENMMTYWSMLPAVVCPAIMVNKTVAGLGCDSARRYRSVLRQGHVALNGRANPGSGVT